MASKLSLDNITPLKQGIAASVLILLADLVNYAGKHPNHHELASGIWTNGVAMMFFYVIINCILAVVGETKTQYFRESIYVFLGLGVFTILVSRLISGSGMDDAGSFRWLFMVLSLCYLIFIGIINTIHVLLNLAEKLGSGPKNKF